MSLRVRLLLVVATTFAVVIVGSVYAAHVSTERELRSETDRFLVQRAHEPGITSGYGEHGPGPLPGGPGGSGAQPVSGNEHAGGPPLAEPDAIVQLLDTGGSVVQSIADQPAIPVDAVDKHMAAHGGPNRFRTVSVSGTQYRVLTTALPGGGAAQIARSIADTNGVLSALDLRLLLIALIGTAVAAALAWLIARRIIRPVEQLTVAAEQIALTQELEHHIEISRHDEIGRLADSFNTMLAALGSSRAQQRRLVMDASHELRTPLTALRTNIELLQRAGTLDEGLDEQQRAELVDAAQVELAELGDLVSELVDLATDARAEEPVQRVDLGDLVGHVVERERRRSGRTITLTRATAAPVDVRSSAIDRAVHNLIDNACKFSPADTPVEIDVNRGVVEVRDRGVGVAADEHALVFDRFYRAAAARSQPGSGLGLSIVRQIAQMHGGTIELVARSGGGTIARLTLPASG